MQPQPRGEAVVLVARIAVRFVNPELFARDERHVESAGEGFDGEPFAAADAPRDVVLTECKGGVRLVGIGSRQQANHQVGLPAAFAAVVPAVACGDDPHAAGILDLDVGRQQPLPGAVATMLPEVEPERSASLRRRLRLRLCLRLHLRRYGRDPQHPGKQQKKPPKTRRACIHIPRCLP